MAGRATASSLAAWIDAKSLAAEVVVKSLDANDVAESWSIQVAVMIRVTVRQFNNQVLG